MASLEDPREIYCEVIKQQNSTTEISVNWKLKNNKETAWNNKM